MFEKIISILALIIFIIEIKTSIRYLKEKWLTFINLNESHLNRLVAVTILVICLVIIAFLLFVSFTIVLDWMKVF